MNAMPRAWSMPTKPAQVQISFVSKLLSPFPRTAMAYWRCLTLIVKLNVP